MNDFNLSCVFSTIMDFQPPKSENRVLIWRLFMEIDEYELASNHFYQLAEKEDQMLDNTLICDCVWIKDAAEGEMNTRYFMRSNSCDEQG